LPIIDSGVEMQDAVSKAERYRKEANKYGDLAKNAQPAYLGDVYRKVAVRYVFMAEELLQSERRRDAVSGFAAAKRLSNGQVAAQRSYVRARDTGGPNGA
jgi:hypothetical protein